MYFDTPVIFYQDKHGNRCFVGQTVEPGSVFGLNREPQTIEFCRGPHSMWFAPKIAVDHLFKVGHYTYSTALHLFSLTPTEFTDEALAAELRANA